MKTKQKAIIGIAAAAIVGVGFWAFSGKNKEFKATYDTAKVEKGTISNSVTATGSIEPVTEVEVGTQVSGIVDKIFVDYNSVVKKGDVIAELDKTNLLSELSTAQSNCASSKSQLDYQQSNYNRYKTMHNKGLISDNDFENARLSYVQAKESYQTSLNSLAKAKTNLSYATITSPIDGVILSKAVEEGQTVAASFSTPTLFTIAQDLTDMRVIANVDEADIGDIAVGQRVSFTVDAYPNDTFEGRVTQVRQEATTTSNVVTYEVVISAPNQNLKLKPGLTANVTIYTLEKKDILKVPAKALRFTPKEGAIGKEDKIEDCAGDTKVWTREGNTFKAHAVKTGITNGTDTEILSGIAAGTVIITDMEAGTMPGENGGAAPDKSASSEKSPFAPGPPGSNKKK